jgi:hypothetical protein
MGAFKVTNNKTAIKSIKENAMSYIAIPAPGKIINGIEVGPCLEQCKHTDCEEMRSDAESICEICDMPLGYDYNITMASNGEYVHFVCATNHPDFVFKVDMEDFQ